MCLSARPFSKMCLPGSTGSSLNRLLTSGCYLALCLFVLLLTPVARAQNPSPDALPVEDCPPPPPLSPQPCLTLDARKAIDSLAEPLVFRWNMGDGQVKEGHLFDYCYAKRGRYVITLDVVNPRTG